MEETKEYSQTKFTPQKNVINMFVLPDNSLLIQTFNMEHDTVTNIRLVQGAALELTKMLNKWKAQLTIK